MVQEAVNEWKSKYESTQNDLMSKVQRLDEAEAKVRFQALTVEAIEKQNDELRNRDQTLIHANVLPNHQTAIVARLCAGGFVGASAPRACG